ncbi:MAG: hypothetical protein A2Y78_03145 [Acidobacteria bacterium RBG_13_68_16]|nr:MAG: hypothetical protein A2Y78_03145 [Acidobacteria bacterium RBG_13_68_16]
MTRNRLLSGLARGLVAIVAVAVAVLGVQHALTLRAQRRDVVKLLAETGLAGRQPEVARAAAMDPDPVRGRLAVARALLAEAFDYGAFGALPPREAAEAAAGINDRLDLARTIAAETLAARPSAWQAAMILGGATYRLWSSRGDPRVFGDRTGWEGPLLAAARLAPGEDEPLRFLAVAWLEIWPTLTSVERSDALPTMRRAFQDSATFARCAELWLSAAPDPATAFELVPDDSRAWSVLEGLYAGKAEWDGFCVARLRRDQALERELRQRVVEAGEHLRGGDRSGARSLAVGVVTTAPVELRFRDCVEAALALCPPGQVSAQEPVRRWLAWAVEGFVRGQTRLSPAAVARLAASAGELPAGEAALAELAAGNLAQAEVVERRNETPRIEAWAPYWIAKARVLTERGKAAEAAAALSRVHRSWGETVPAAEARLTLARARGDDAEMKATSDSLSAAAASWPATAWQWRGPVARLDLLAGADAAGCAVSLDVVPLAGAVVRVSLDGATVAVAPVRPDGRLVGKARVARGPHVLAFETAAGGRVVPGKVELIPEEGKR